MPECYTDRIFQYQLRIFPVLLVIFFKNLVHKYDKYLWAHSVSLFYSFSYLESSYSAHKISNMITDFSREHVLFISSVACQC